MRLSQNTLKYFFNIEIHAFVYVFVTPIMMTNNFFTRPLGSQHLHLHLEMRLWILQSDCLCSRYLYKDEARGVLSRIHVYVRDLCRRSAI